MVRELDVASLEVALDALLDSPYDGSIRSRLEAFAVDNDVPVT
jgi:signal transduction protein with GAF and PtsI domain